jgi:hypothetical protein
MGCEARRVPANWQHPKQQVFNHCTLCMEDTYRPLHRGEKYQPDVDKWDEECAKWKAGKHPDCCKIEYCAMTYEQYEEQRPHRDDYMPNWPAEERTHLMMYENTTEGTPISPAFATAEELARWLTDNNATWFASSTCTYETWLRVCLDALPRDR